MTRMGRLPRRAKLSSTNASYRAKVSPCGRRAASVADRRICWTRITLVTAAIVPAGPILVSHSDAARAMGSKGRGSRDVMVSDASSVDRLSGASR